MNTGIDWEEIRKELDLEEWVLNDCGDQFERFVFLGTVMDLYPSGKYYTPWACSNLSCCSYCNGTGRIGNQDCSECGGLGGEEAYLDQQYGEALESEAEEHGLFITWSEGDPCDILVGETLDAALCPLCGSVDPKDIVHDCKGGTL